MYQELFNVQDGHGTGMIAEHDGQVGGDAAEPISQSQRQADIAAQCRVAQSLLLIDARRLVEASTYLENLLEEKSMRTWLIHGLL